MNEIKPIAYFSATKEGKIIWSEDCCCEDPVYPRHDDDDSVSLAVYSESSKQSLQQEVVHWKANHTDLKERLHVATHRTDLPSDRLPLFDKMKAEIAALQKENAEQKRKIIIIEKELVEWNEFKKIRDAQMQALRKQMP